MHSYYPQHRPGPICRADLERQCPPPDWSEADERAFCRAWSRPHVSNPEDAERRLALERRARREASALPTAEQWRAYFKGEGPCPT